MIACATHHVIIDEPEIVYLRQIIEINNALLFTMQWVMQNFACRKPYCLLILYGYVQIFEILLDQRITICVSMRCAPYRTYCRMFFATRDAWVHAHTQYTYHTLIIKEIISQTKSPLLNRFSFTLNVFNLLGCSVLCWTVYKNRAKYPIQLHATIIILLLNYKALHGLWFIDDCLLCVTTYANGIALIVEKY